MLSTSRDGERPQLKIATILKGMAEKQLKEAKVEPGMTKMAGKQMPGTVGTPLGKLTTNCYEIEMKKKMPIYHFYIDVEAITGRPNVRPAVLTQNAVRSDYRLVELRYMCNGVFKAFKQRMGKDGNFFWYDLNHLGYSLMDLKLPKNGISETFDKEEVLHFFPDIDADFIKYTMTVKPMEGVITLADYSHLSDDMAHIDRAIDQFLDIATSQEIFDDPVHFSNYSAQLYYLLHPAEFGFTDDDCPEFAGNSSFLGIGGRKGVRPIELANGRITSGLVVEVKKSPFHIDLQETIHEKLKKSFERFEQNQMSPKEVVQKCEGLVKGVWVRTLHRPGKFEVYGISEQTALSEIIEGGDSVNTYFVKKYDWHLHHPDVPLVIRKLRNGQLVGIPMELCQVLDDQRVKNKQQAPAQVQQMIRHCAVPPTKLSVQNTRVVKALNLAGTEYLSQAMIDAHSEPVEVEARVIPPPDMRFYHQNIRKPMPNGTWTGAQYLLPASCAKWAAIVFFYERDSRNDLSLDTWKNFVEKYQQLMASNGMAFSTPTVERHGIPSHETQSARANQIVKLAMDKLFEAGIEFVLIAHPDGADQIHHAMKFHEQKTEVVTQGVKITTVRNVLSGKHLTLANIVQKTNVKMGGLNYDISSGILQEMPTLFSKDTLVIGFSMNHPGADTNLRELSDELAREMNGIPRTSINANGHNGNVGGVGNGNIRAPGNGNIRGPGNGNVRNGANGNGPVTTTLAPSVVGFSANVGKKNTFEFMGDFLFQAPLRNEKVDILQRVVKRLLIQFKNTHKAFPKRIIIYRDGVDQGAFENILKFEVSLLKNTMAEMDCNAKVTLMVVNKKQPIRLYRQNVDPRAKAPDQNVPPGTVVDTGVVHPNWTEFYLNSHRAIQGTARTPCYTVLVNEENLGVNALEAMTHHFCYGHQIVYSPTSLPTPVYVAMECAKRGRNIYNFHAASKIANGAITPQERELMRNYQDLTTKLSWENTEFLRTMRINA